ncbi:MAG: hypothetical protein K5705_12770, partial [Oscillospiraceae bacterium]|nr:hypothetical protein [Oscillospiraceae bacterium]
DGTSVIDRTHMETRLTVPAEKLAETDCLYYAEDENMILSCNGVDYMLLQAQFGAYETEFNFRVKMDEFLAAAPEDARIDTNIFKDGALNEALVLTVDGTEYRCNPDCCYIWWDSENKGDTAGFGYIAPIFGQIDYDSAATITLSVGDASLSLKNSPASGSAEG